MTDVTDEAAPEVPDRRRAIALLSHLANVDGAGARFIIQQARDAERLPHLLAAVIDNGRVIFGAFRTPMAIEGIGSALEGWAQQTADADYRRAASALIARPHNRHDLVKQQVDEAVAAGRLNELVYTAAQMFITLMPELVTPWGKNQLGQMSAAIAGWNDDDDPQTHPK